MDMNSLAFLSLSLSSVAMVPGTVLRRPSAPTNTSNSNWFRKWSDGFSLACQPLQREREREKSCETNKYQDDNMR